MHEQRGKRLIKEAEARRNAEISELKHKHQVSRKRKSGRVRTNTRWGEEEEGCCSDMEKR